MTKSEGRPPRAARRSSSTPPSAVAAPAAAQPGAQAGASEPQARPHQRIAKLMARVGLCSRRDAEAWILEGRVSINGEVLTSPARDVGPDDRVLVDDVPLPSAEKTRLFLFHKPRGLVTSDRDPEGRATVADYLHDHWPEGPRVVTIGRLDINTEGLLLLTNDGGLARTLELPETGWVRRYRVRAKGETDQAKLDTLFHGVTIDGIDYAGIEAKLDRTQGANCWLTMGLREGKNREIKRVCESLGLEVNRLIRLSFGPFQLLDLAEGAVEEVRPRVLRDQLGERLAAQAGATFEVAEAVATPPERVATRRGEPRTQEARRAAPVRGERAAAEKRPERAATTEPRRERSGEQSGARPARAKREAAPLERSPRDRPERDRPDRDRPETETREPERHERPPGPRRHVSTLRADEAAVARFGPRKRIERSDTKDRHDRTITVERLVDTRPVKAAPPRSQRPARARTGESGLSPSAAAKRVRVARSGNAAEGEGPRRFARERPARTSGAERSDRPARSRPEGERPDRSRQEPSRPEPSRADRSRPDRSRPDRSRPDDSRTGGARAERAGGAGRDRVRSDAPRGRPDAGEARRPRPSGDATVRHRGGAERPAASKPAASKPAGFADKRGRATRAGDARTENTRAGDRPTGAKRTGDARAGDKRAGAPARTGSSRPSAGRSGADRPSTGRSSAGKPSTGKSFAGKPSSGKTGLGKSGSGKPGSGKPGGGARGAPRGPGGAPGGGRGTPRPRTPR